MSNIINSVIKLRTDTISSWLSNSSAVLNDKELVVIRYSDGTIGLKLGNGETYANTDALKFNTLLASYLSDGTSTFSFPSNSGTLALDRGSPVENTYNISGSSQSISITPGVDNVFTIDTSSSLSSSITINLSSISLNTYKYNTKVLFNITGLSNTNLIINSTMLSTNNLVNSFRENHPLDLVNAKISSTSYQLTDEISTSTKSILIEFNLIGTSNYLTKTTLY